MKTLITIGLITLFGLMSPAVNAQSGNGKQSPETKPTQQLKDQNSKPAKSPVVKQNPPAQAPMCCAVPPLRNARPMGRPTFTPPAPKEEPKR